MNQTQHLASPAMLCEQFQRDYFAVVEALAAAGVKPAMTLDLVPYYDWNIASRVMASNPPAINGSGAYV